jgi:hypothetical protein
MEADKVTAEMQEVTAELEMNLATNKNVIEQFQRRKEEVGLSLQLQNDGADHCIQIETLTASLVKREARSEKIEQSIKNARVGLSILAKDLSHSDVGWVGTCVTKSGRRHRQQVFHRLRT